MRRGIRVVAVAGLVAAGMAASAQADEGRVDVVVGVTVRAAIAPMTLARALDVATHVYAAAGVRVSFVPTSEMLAVDATCRRQLMVVSWAPARMPASHQLGFTGRSTDQPGQIAYVFHDEVVRTAAGRPISIAGLLGYAIAHELGHMLLPPGHADAGVMRATWLARDFDEMRKGSLMIGAHEAAAIATYLDSNERSR